MDENLEMKGENEDIGELLMNIMEGYSDSVIPLLSDLQTDNKTFSPRKKPKIEVSSSLLLGSSQEERERREKMMTEPDQISVLQSIDPNTQIIDDEQRQQTSESCRNKPKLSKPVMNVYRRKNILTHKFSVLQSMIPNINSKAVKTQIVEATIDYIQKLEEQIKGLEGRKKKSTLMNPSSNSSAFQNSGAAINVTVSENVAFFGVQTEVRSRFLFSRVLKVFEKQKVGILSATVSTFTEKQITMSVTALVDDKNGDIEAIKEELIRLLCLKL